MTPPRASRSKSHVTGANPAPLPVHSDSCQGAAGTSGASLDFMSKVPSPIGDVPRLFQWLYQLGLPLRPSASQSMAAPLAILSSQTLELLSAEVMPPPQGVLKKVSPTGGVGGFLDNIPLSQRIAPVLPKEAEEPVAAGNIGSVSDGGDISPLEASDTEDDDSDDDDIQALDILISYVLPPINYMKPPAAEVAAAAAAIAASTTGGAPIITPAAGPSSSHLEAIEHDLEQVPPCLVGRLRKARFGLAEMMHKLAETLCLSCGNIVQPSTTTKRRKCRHEHWKNCQDYPEEHTWVAGQPEYCEEEEEVRALIWAQANEWPEAAEEDYYVEEDEALRIRQLSWDLKDGRLWKVMEDHGLCYLGFMWGRMPHTSYRSNLTSGDAGPSPHHPAPLAAFVITPRDSLILQEHITQFQNGSPSACANIIEKLIPELYQLRPPNTPFDKKDAGKKIQKWFYNHYIRPQCQYTKFTHKWSSRSVFYQLNRDEVLELARETSGMDPGAPGFLGALQDATTVLWNTLDADDQEDYAQAAKEWSQDAPPTHIQSRMASSLRKQIVQDFQRQLFKTCGICTLVLSAYKIEDNDLSIGLDDVESALDDGISFLNFCPDWKTAPLWEQWTQFGINCFSQVDDPLEEDPVEVLAKPDRSKTITTKIPISMDMSGCPKLPTVTMLDGYKTKVVQSMLREYCTAHMRFITGRKNKVIPWGSLIGEIFRLLDHWRDRQDQGHVPLTWVPSCPAFQEGQPSQCLQKIRETVVAMQPLEADEEVFVLPHSNEIDEEEDEADPGNTGAVEEPLPVVDAFQVEPGVYLIHII
ncbi:hypothetical protein EI94DRAFT_1703852 [Lactarius quietus]|nr:hypothetical protein EI94DRAFT_1703852 [Lactarius quietus]